MSVAVVERRVTARELEEARAKLSQAIRAFWATPEGQWLRLELSAAARSFGIRLREVAASLGLSEAYRRAAIETNLSAEYKRAWGKPA
jgi:ABC-type cobalamin transport system ATPase subunit